MGTLKTCIQYYRCNVLSINHRQLAHTIFTNSLDRSTSALLHKLIVEKNITVSLRIKHEVFGLTGISDPQS